MSEPILKTENLRYSYTEPEEEPVDVLRQVTLSVEPGTFTAVLGHNGSGKSTLAKHFNAILLPTGGKVWTNGMDTADEELLLKIRKCCGMVFQNPDNQIVASVVEDDVAFAPENLGYPPEEIRKRVDDSLKAVGMYEYRERAPHLLSGGQKQRVAIAGVLAMHPRCVVFDESTAMLDPRGRRDVLEIISSLRDEGITVLLITHNMNEAIGADRIIVLSDGQIVMDGAPKEIFPRVEELRSLGLTVPDTVGLLWELRQRGLDVPLDALTVDECAEAIAAALGNGT